MPNDKLIETLDELVHELCHQMSEYTSPWRVHPLPFPKVIIEYEPPACHYEVLNHTLHLDPTLALDSMAKRVPSKTMSLLPAVIHELFRAFSGTKLHPLDELFGGGRPEEFDLQLQRGLCIWPVEEWELPEQALVHKLVNFKNLPPWLQVLSTLDEAFLQRSMRERAPIMIAALPDHLQALDPQRNPEPMLPLIERAFFEAIEKMVGNRFLTSAFYTGAGDGLLYKLHNRFTFPDEVFWQYWINKDGAGIKELDRHDA